MRIVKEAEERRNEILDAAMELFFTKGFDKTSINDILNEVQIAKGTLYYYFKSKEDIMDALIERLTNITYERAKLVSEDTSMSVLERLSGALGAMNIEQLTSNKEEELMAYMHRPQNALLHQKSQKALVKCITEIIGKIVEEGIEEGIFETDYPYQATEMALIYSSTVFDDMYGLSMDEMGMRMEGFQYNLERLLGAQTSLQPMLAKLFEENK